MGFFGPNVEKMEKKNDVNGLIKALKHKDSDVQDRAEKALVRIGKPAVECLIQALKDENSGVRERAIRALGQIKDERAVEPLLLYLGREERHEIAIQLKEKGWKPKTLNEKVAFYIALEEWKEVISLGKMAVPYLAKLMSDESPRIRLKAAEALVKIPDPIAVPALLQAIYDGDAWVDIHGRVMFTDKTRLLGGKDALSVPLAKMATVRVRIRDMCIRALVAIGEPAVEGLLSAAVSPVEVVEVVDQVALRLRIPHVRESAFTALTRIGKASTEALISLLKNKEVDVRNRALRALQKITGENYGDDYEKWHHWWEENRK